MLHAHSDGHRVVLVTATRGREDLQLIVVVEPPRQADSRPAQMRPHPSRTRRQASTAA